MYLFVNYFNLINNIHTSFDGGVGEVIKNLYG